MLNQLICGTSENKSIGTHCRFRAYPRSATYFGEDVDVKTAAISPTIRISKIELRCPLRIEKLIQIKIFLKIKYPN
jgi:hypothetical protein